MGNKSEIEADSDFCEVVEAAVKEVVAEVSVSVQKSYEMIDLRKVPNHVNYAKIEKYLRSVNVEITRKMFLSYINEELLPGNHVVKNAHYSFYTKEQIIYYILIDMFKPILPLSKIKVLFSDILKPMIDDMGIESTYKVLYTIIRYMNQRFEESVERAIKDNMSIMENLGLKVTKEIIDEKATVKQNIEQYSNVVTLCMAIGALDFYKNSPNTLLD